MNLLFLCHAGLDSNSMGHIAGFARPLAARGHALVVGVPEPSDLRGGGDLPGLRIQPATFDRLREEPRVFPDGRGADVVHAWTPREHVRRVAFDLLRRTPGARLVVHLEDNERFLSEALAGESWDGLLALPARTLARRLPGRATHPRWGDIFLGLADAVTGITPALRDLAPADRPFLAVRPAVDFTRFHPGPANPAERAALGIGAGERVVIYPGNSHPGNRTELLALYRAVERLNAHGGQPTRLLRTGTDTGRVAPEFAAANRAPFVTHLGLVERGRLPGLLRLADALVQPGAPDEFNRYRLPSKLPEFLAVGRPVLLPACNLADELTEGEEALFLRRGTAEEIMDGLARVFADPDLAQRLGAAATAAAHRLFDGEGSAAALAELYADVLHRPPNARLNVLRRPAAGGGATGNSDDARNAADEPALLAGLLRAELSDWPVPPSSERTRATGQLVDALAAAAVPEPRPESPVARCQVFFPVGNLYDEAAAGNLPLGPEGRWRRLTFWWLEPRSGGLHPRVDVADRPGLVDVAAATVRDARDGRVLWRGRRARDFDRVRVEGDALRLAHPRGLRVFCTGSDPQLYLPPLDPSFIPLDVPVRVTLWVRFCAGPALGEVLARMSERLLAAGRGRA